MHISEERRSSARVVWINEWIHGARVYQDYEEEVEGGGGGGGDLVLMCLSRLDQTPPGLCVIFSAATRRRSSSPCLAIVDRKGTSVCRLSSRSSHPSAFG